MSEEKAKPSLRPLWVVVDPELCCFGPFDDDKAANQWAVAHACPGEKLTVQRLKRVAGTVRMKVLGVLPGPKAV